MKTTLVIMAAGLGSRYGGNKQVDGVGPNNEILMEYSRILAEEHSKPLRKRHSGYLYGGEW